MPNVYGYDPTLNNQIAKKNKVINKLSNINLFDIYIILIKHDKIKQLIKKIKNKKNNIFNQLKNYENINNRFCWFHRF